ncbi:hypothetical protein ACFL6W_10080 [Thermodesulfobacteriota bacterium]
MKNLKLYVLLFFLSASMFILQCAENRPNPIYVKDGIEYGKVKGAFRARWWNYYERAQSFAEGGFYDEAIKDLKQAIEGRTQDMRMAPTYGTGHFIDYFPHRELGIVYYKTGWHEEAEKELELSLSMVDTGRAKFHLNQVRKAILEVTDADKEDPSINLSAASEIGTTNTFSINLEGEVEDDTYARDIEINEEPLFIELSSKRLPFKKKIKLKKGMNEIRIKSSDLLGNVTEKPVKVFADFEGPALKINDYFDGQRVGEKKIVLNGAIADESGVKSLRINGEMLAYNNQKEIEFKRAIELNEGENKIVIAATDITGNTTTGEMKLTYVPQLANNDTNKNRKLSRPNKPIRVALAGSRVTQLDRVLLAQLTAANKPGAAFEINLKDLDDTQTVYYEDMYVDGSATGTNKINTVKINGSKTLIVPGETIYFGRKFPLNEGENLITLEVIDEMGNSESKTVKVIRKIQNVLKNTSRMSMAIIPFEKIGNISSDDMKLYDVLIRDAFLDQKRFRIVSRGRVFETALNEIKLSQSGLVDEEEALRLGKLVGAEGILEGHVRETADSITIFAEFTNTETGEGMEARDVYCRKKTFERKQYIANGLALKFQNSFPLIEGIVMETEGNKIFADLGTVQGIKKEMKFIVYRLGKPKIHPRTKKAFEAPYHELGIATVKNVYNDYSMGELHTQFDPSEIRVEDLIITK